MNLLYLLKLVTSCEEFVSSINKEHIKCEELGFFVLVTSREPVAQNCKETLSASSSSLTSDVGKYDIAR